MDIQGMFSPARSYKLFFLPYRIKDTDSEEDMIGERIPTSANRWANDLSTHSTDTTVDSNKLTYNVHGRKDPPKLRCDIISPISRETTFRSQY